MSNFKDSGTNSSPLLKRAKAKADFAYSSYLSMAYDNLPDEGCIEQLVDRALAKGLIIGNTRDEAVNGARKALASAGLFIQEKSKLYAARQLVGSYEGAPEKVLNFVHNELFLDSINDITPPPRRGVHNAPRELSASSRVTI